ncbi:AraC family transcriptional regulator [Photobacterium galatheae]|uniref:AraC family transcriptional regulator n=1 Tax=Photobacterium galatheae TaxID=1654360 RepID=A0A066RKZ0_9GAMM|nr:AraC family transcriptional regulator [Photobacterium galatheae]KDM91105.1 AraC family transcriptional regulator [Photobacterium galatheae]MCM0150173.1 AraC family transcriptional regulator [Photobacterium galatheae]
MVLGKEGKTLRGTHSTKEFSKLWRPAQNPEIELLSASFQRFEFSRHWHDELAIGVIESGAEGLFYRGNNLVVPQHQIVAINPSEVHTGFSGCEQGWRYRMFYLPPEFIASHFQASEKHVEPVINTSLIRDPALFGLLLQCHMALEVPSLDLTQSSLLTLALEQLFTQYGTAKSDRDITGKATDRTKQVRDYLHDHWQENVSLEALETVSGLTKFQLIRYFKAHYGLTPHQFLLLLKVQKAKGLLMSGHSCVDTALSCGFFDQSHFTRNFKRAFGVPPKHYMV